MKLKIVLIFIALTFLPCANAATWFINANTGDDNYDGTSAIYISGTTGPKKTINDALSMAASSDTLYISEGIYEETLFIDKSLVIRGSNWGIDPLLQARNPETIIVPSILSLGIDVSGNSIIEIASCCVEIDGLTLLGDNPNISTIPTKYSQEYEISYGIGSKGPFYNLHFTNLIISHFAFAGIHLTSGIFSTQSNKIEKCKINTGEQNSEAIVLAGNFYSDIDFISIDATYKGIVFNDFSDKNNIRFTFSNLNILAENAGITLNNFTGNTDSLFFENNIINPFDPAIDFTGIALTDISSKGFADISNNDINDAYSGIIFKNLFDNFKINFTGNKISNGKIGIYIEQSIITPSFNLIFNNSDFTGQDSAAIITAIDGDIITIDLTDIRISQAANGIILNGNAGINPYNTAFDNITRYYYYLDSSSTGLRPVNMIDATNAVYDGVLGNMLSKDEAFAVENKIRHYLDRNTMGWILFQDQNLFVSNYDGNDLLSPAFKIASNDWNIYMENINSSETVLVDKTIHLYPHPSSGIGKFIVSSKNHTLYIHGKIYLSEGLELIQGIIETTQSDTLIVYRSFFNTVLDPGNSLSFVRGPLYIRYINIPENEVIKDTIPIGLNDDYRPVYLNMTWPVGLFYFDLGFKSFNGKAPIALPSDISHVSDVRYWQITNPSNLSGLTFNSVGFLYDTLIVNDLVNDPANLRVVFKDGVGSYNLGGAGTLNKRGSIMSTTGAPRFGYYTLGNAMGGMNLLSADQPIAIINTTGHCKNDSITITAGKSLSDAPVLSWEWNILGPSTVLSPENSDTIKKKISVAGNYTVTLIITNTKGFKDTAITTIIIDDLPSMSYTSKSPCFPLPIEAKNTSVIPSSTTIAETEWKINSSFFSTPDLNYTPSVSGFQNGYLKVTLSNGCSDTISISVESPISPQITFIPKGMINLCAGDSILIKINKSAGNVIWNDGLKYDSLILKSNTFKKATIYSSGQCFRSDSVSIKILERPVVNAGPDFTTLPGKPVTLKGSSNSMIEWMPATWLNDASILNPISRPLITTRYILRAYNTTECEATDTMTVFVNSENTSDVPNLLTPNDDGHNDSWVLSNISDPENCNVNVFTREGQLVYSANSYKNNWNGTRDSVVLPDGYYVFVIENKSSGKVYSGILNILK